MSEERVSVEVAQLDCYRFEVRFPGTDLPVMLTDEPMPLGRGQGPNPVRLLAASVANCLAASLLFALEKNHTDPQPVTAQIDVDMVQNETGRVRVGAMAVRLMIGKPWADLAQVSRALEQFDALCVVTESVRTGIPVSVDVCDINGAVLEDVQTSL
ncbi:OsmC family protein [Burkholderia sp. Ac-20353]|uniref:OsmC family protein n=1 Tax=Burkholderia sp. Ac-20353 TaxID=2703894 RepID=UPI00197C084F|nr:OsmC family protein [Burkholderia sp. Ac-20353]MBN3790508.1 OsmC family protein [Burkholderia sp. Ac-20353]